jgi:ketosteroid isomerase-like protein
MADTDLTTIAREFLDAFNAGDWSRFAARLDPDVAYEETGTGRSTRARTPTSPSARAGGGVPDATGVLHRAVASGDTVAQEVTWEGTQAGPLPTPSGTLPASGRRIAVPATLWLTLRDGRATGIHHHLDLLTMLQQRRGHPGPRRGDGMRRTGVPASPRQGARAGRGIG